MDCFRYSRNIYCVVNFHGYGFGKKGIRSKIELLENLRDRKGLNKKKANILAGNFNFVEHKHDRKSGTEEAWSKEKNIRDLHSVLTKNFSLYVRFSFINKFVYSSLSGAIYNWKQNLVWKWQKWQWCENPFLTWGCG